VKSKYGAAYSATLPKLKTGTGMVQNAEYNDGKPWFVEFRPLLHETTRLTDEEISQYIKYNKEIEELEKRVNEMKARGVETSDIELELKLAKDKVKEGMFSMAETYMESIRARMKRV
jgi:hypothetical protein